MCIESLSAAVADASAVFAANGSASYTLTIDPGVYDLTAETSATNPTAKGVLDVSRISPEANGLNIAGGGSGGPNATVLQTDNSLVTVWGSRVSHVHLSGLFFERGAATTTFGTAISCNTSGYVDLQIPAGFPTVQSIYMGIDGGRMYVRAYDDSDPTSPVPLNDGTPNDDFNRQLTWGDTAAPTLQPSGAWRVFFDDATQAVPSYYCDAGVVVAVKSKFDADAYNFIDVTRATGTDVGFDDVVWQDEGRGAFRNITHAYVTNASIVPRAPINGQAWVLSTPAGGPQFGDPSDGAYAIQFAIVSNFTATNTGDDSVAVFNDNYGSGCTVGTGAGCSGSATLNGLTISNSFARDVNLYNSCLVTLTDISNTGCNLSLFDDPTNYGGCITDTNQISAASERIPECTPDFPL